MGIALLVLAASAGVAAAQTGEIHCKHFFYGYPTGTHATNDLVIRDAYALSSNDATRFADWAAYRLTPHEVFGWLDLDRAWRSDLWLESDERLEATPLSQDDFRLASAADYDRGHLAPLGSFVGVAHASEVNVYSNVVPQRPALNRGPWGALEEAERALVLRRALLDRDRAPVWVLAGTLYERDMPPLPYANEAHRVPSGFWKVVAVQDGVEAASVVVAAFVFDQDTPAGGDPLDHLVTVDEVEARTGLELLRLLPEDVEGPLESALDADEAEALLFPEE
jgi:endonuclease G, mitochondrial